MADKRDEKPQLVTVLMATYNDDRFVGDAIESVRCQTMPDFKFVIVDDCSTDSTPAVLERFARLDDRIQIIRNETNLGLTRSLNVGLRHVHSRFLARFDADDVCMKERLEKQTAYMLGHPDCDFLATRAKVISAAGTYIKKTKKFRAKDLKSYLLNVGNPFVHSSMMIRTSTVDELGGYNEEWSAKQDYELWLRAAFANKSFGFLSDALVCHRFHANSVSSSPDHTVVASLLLRAYYRAKSRGRDVDLVELRRRLENSELLGASAQYVARRRRMKHIVAVARSRPPIVRAACLSEVVPLMWRTRRRMWRKKRNMMLDQVAGT